MAKKYSKKLSKKMRLLMVGTLTLFGALLLFGYFKSSGPDIKYMNAINLGAEWFLNNQNDDFLNYEYHIDRNYYTKNDDRLKKMGSLWAISETAKLLNNEELQKLTTKGLKYYEYYMDYDVAEDFYNLNFGGIKNIGASAYMILTLLNSDYPKKDEYLTKLANGIIYLQEKNGKFKEYFYGTNKGNQNYYPGLATFALLKLYEYNNRKSLLESANKSFKYYSSIFDSKPNIAFIPTNSMAYNELYKITKDKNVAKFIEKMNNYLLQKEKLQKQCGDFKFTKGITTATYLQGVISAYQTAILDKNRQDARCYKNYIKEGINYILKLQVTNDNKYELPAIGGFMMDRTSKTVTAEREANAMLALINAYNSNILD